MKKPAILPVFTVLGVLLTAACASAPPSGDWEQVRVVEETQEGMEHHALPTEMDGCEYLGKVQTSAPAGVSEADAALLEALRKKAVAKGGDTLVLLPGRPIVMESLRGSVFRCGSGV